MSFHLQDFPGSDQTDNRKWCLDGYFKCPQPLEGDFCRCHVPSEILVQCSLDQASRSVSCVISVSIRERPVPCSPCGRVDEGVADVEYEGQLNDGQEKHRQQSADQDEIDHSRSPFPPRTVRAPEGIPLWNVQTLRAP